MFNNGSQPYGSSLANTTVHGKVYTTEKKPLNAASQIIARKLTIFTLTMLLQ